MTACWPGSKYWSHELPMVSSLVYCGRVRLMNSMTPCRLTQRMKAGANVSSSSRRSRALCASTEAPAWRASRSLSSVTSRTTTTAVRLPEPAGASDTSRGKGSPARSPRSSRRADVARRAGIARSEASASRHGAAQSAWSDASSEPRRATRARSRTSPRSECWPGRCVRRRRRRGLPPAPRPGPSARRRPRRRATIRWRASACPRSLRPSRSGV